jgi:hypothetical protein
MITQDVFRKISAEWHAIPPSQIQKCVDKIWDNLMNKQEDLYCYIMSAKKNIDKKRRHDFLLDVTSIYGCFEKVYGNKIRPLSDKELDEIMDDTEDLFDYLMFADEEEMNIHDFLEKLSCGQQLIECVQRNSGLMPMVARRLHETNKKMSRKEYANRTFEFFILFSIIYALDKAVYYSPLKITKTLRDT